MPMKNVLGKINELIEKEDAVYLQDDQGNLHPMNDAIEKGIKGTPVKRSGKDELYDLLFGKKERIGEREIKAIDQTAAKLKEYIIGSLSPATKARLSKPKS